MNNDVNIGDVAAFKDSGGKELTGTVSILNPFGLNSVYPQKTFLGIWTEPNRLYISGFDEVRIQKKEEINAN